MGESDREGGSQGMGGGEEEKVGGEEVVGGEERGEGNPPSQEEGSEDSIFLFGKYRVKRCIEIDPRSGERCKSPSLKGNSYCKSHARDAIVRETHLVDATLPKRIINLPSDFQREVRALRKFLLDLTDITDTPKVLNRVNDLIEVVERLESKMKAHVTKQQIQQLGFYFASILFKYINDGQRYEEAKKEFIDAVLKAGAYDQDELNEVIRSSSEVRLYESI